MHRAHLRTMLYGVGALLILLAGYRACFSVPASRISMPVAPVPAADITPGMYRLAPGEVLRFLPRPSRDVRRAVCRAIGLPAREANRRLIALNLTYDGTLHLKSLEVGYEYVPRSLAAALLHSLSIPTWRIHGLDVARYIGLSGDWVVRAGAPPEKVMEAVVQIVRRAGYPGFRAVPVRTSVPAVVLRGQPVSNAEPIELLSATDASQRVPISTGDPQTFARVLSNAIERPVRWQANPPAVTLRWRDHSPARRAMGMPTTERLVRQTLADVARRLGVEIADESIETTIWKLSLDGTSGP